MAASFNLTAQINLRGPANVKPIVSKIQKEINSAKIKLNLDVNQNAAKSITSITSRLNNLSKAANNANTSISALNGSLSTLVSSLNNINSSATSNVNSLAKTTQAVSSAGKAVSQTRSQIEEFGKQSGLAIKRFAAFSTVTSVVFGLVNAFDSAFKEFFNFNQEIVRLSQVTGKSVTELGDVSKEITKLSTSLGVASSDLLTVATTLAQAGLSAEDTKIALEALAKSALAPSFDSLTDTTEGAIAAIRQFGLQTKELDSALGSINAVSAAFAVEASDIIAAIQRTGGVFSSASRGISEGTDALNEFIAIFTSVRATTRESAETIATGLRTIFTRIQRTKTIEQLREFGIELQDTEGKFVGLFEATRRLSEGLSKIDPRTAEFATISEELGGFRQIGKVIPLIQQFAVTEQALAVAQKGSTSTAKDALIAQQSLAVQFARTRENFIALVRELGESSSFKAFVGVSLTLADSFINLARSLKPLLPLLLTFASIKIGGAIREFGSGFGGVFGIGGGGGGPSPTVGGGGTGGGGRGGSGAATALSANTSSLNTLAQTLNLLNQSILALNQNIVNNNSLLINRPAGRFASGGLVPGSGNSDTYKAMLTPGEFVIRKKAVEAIGVSNLAQMNRGGEVQRFMGGTKGRGVKGRRGARSSFKELTSEEMDSLSTADLIKYGKALARDIFSTGGAGLVTGNKFVPVPQERIVSELEPYLQTYLGQKGFWQEQVSPFGRQNNKQISKQKNKLSREAALASQVSRQADEVAARGQQWTAISSGSAIDNYLLSTLKEPILSDYKNVRGGGSLNKEFHNTRLRQAVNKSLDSFDDFDYSPSMIDKLVSGMAAKRFANGGAVQRFAMGTTEQGVKKLQRSEQEIITALRGSGISYPIGNTGIERTLTSKEILKLRASKDSGLPSLSSGSKLAQYAEIAGTDVQTMANVWNKLSTSTQRAKEKATIKAQTAQEEEISRKQQILASGKALRFGLVGLRYGTSASKQFAGGIPPSFSGIERLKTTQSGQPIEIISGSLSSSFSQSFSKNLEKGLLNNFASSVIQVAKSLGSQIGADVNPDSAEIIKRINNAEFFNVVGAGLESAIGLLGAPYVAKNEDTKSIDFPLGLGQASKLFNIPNSIPTDVTRTIGPGGKGASKYLEQIERFLNTPSGQKYLTERTTRQKFAIGGGVHSEDTVPALLTPGEFVFNKKSAQRIGYGTLNRLNKADKVQGFNKGGVVGYANGGIVDNIGGTPGVIAAITAVILPQIEKLSASFGKLDGTLGTFGTALGGAIREASSLTLSAGISLNAVGASNRTVALGQAGAAISGLVGGALTDGTGKALEKALLKNVEVFGKFDKTLQDISNAPTEELRLQAAEDLQKTFAKLDASVQNTKAQIDALEIANNFGSAINDITLTILTSVTAITALSNASKQAASTVALSKATTGVMAPLSIGTKLLGTFGKFIPVVGSIITAVEVGVQLLGPLFNIFGNNLKKSSEQLDRLYKNLDETTKNSQAFSIANSTFVNQTLKEFTRLRERGFSGESLTRELGRTPTLDNLNELNFTFRTLLRSRLVAEGIPFSDTKTMAGLAQSMSDDQDEFNRIFNETAKEFTQRQFVRAQTETGDMTVAEAESRFRSLGGAESEVVKRIVENYVGAKNKEIAALRELTLANNQVKISLVNLDNILITLAGSVETSVNKTIDEFDDLDRKLSIIGGEPRTQGGEILRRQISTLNNIRGASSQDLADVSNSVASLLNISAASPEQQKLFEELRSQVEASRVLQQELPLVLREVQASPDGRAGEALEKTLRAKLGPSIEQITKDASITDTIFRNLGDSINSVISGNKESINSIQELAQSNPAIAALLKTAENAQKTYIDILEGGAKILDKVAEQSKRRVDLENQLVQVTTQRLQAEIQETNELNRLLGVTTSLSDLNKVFDTSIKQLTKNIGGNIPQGGTADINIITRELNLRKKVASQLDTEIQNNSANLQKFGELRQAQDIEIVKINKLNQALTVVATSGEKTKNALDKIAQAQDQFKTRRQLLIDLLKGSTNPETFAQQQAISSSIEAATAGRFMNDQQAFLFLEEGTKYLEAVGASQAKINALIKSAIRSIIRGARPANASEFGDQLNVEAFLLAEGRTFAEILANNLPDVFKPILAKLSPESPRLQLAVDQAERNQAGIAIEQNLIQQINTSLGETLRIFNKFNNKLGNVFTATIDNIKTKEVQTQQQFNNIPQIDPFPEFSKPLKDLLQKFSKPKIETRFLPNGLPYQEFVPERLSKDKISSILIDFGSAQKAQDQLKSLDRAIENLVTTGADGAQFMTVYQAEATREIQKLQNEIRQAIKDQEQGPPTQSSPSRSQLLNQQRAVPTPQINEGASLQQFNGSIDQFSRSSSAIIKPMEDLSANMAIFKTTAEKLSETLNRFTVDFNKEIKASISHSYTGDVNLNLNDTLDVNIQNNPNRDSQLVQNIYDKVIPVIQQTINKIVLG